MNAFKHALAFLTRIPAGSLSADEKDWHNSAIYYPLVGAIVGGLLWLSALLLPLLLPSGVATVLLLCLWVWITGGLHLDGWMDVADGLGSNRDRERMLAIMKDSRVGAMGVIACVLLLLLKASAMVALFSSAWAFFLAPLAARYGLIVVMRTFPYRSSHGLGSGLGKQLKLWPLVLSGLLAGGVAFAVGSWAGVLAIIVSLGISLFLARFLSQKLAGLTGDCYGAIVEAAEVSLLLAVLLAGRFAG